jgi:predicted enzyme related to lactoylglutathione lyase
LDKTQFAGLTSIGQINIPVHDLDRAVAFYREQLGLNFLFRVEKLAFFDCGGVRLLLEIPEAEAFDHPSSILYFKVPDLHAAYETLQARGVAFVASPELVARMPDHELWMAFFEDGEGNTMALMAEVGRAQIPA